MHTHMKIAIRTHEYCGRQAGVVFVIQTNTMAAKNFQRALYDAKLSKCRYFVSETQLLLSQIRTA